MTDESEDRAAARGHGGLGGPGRLGPAGALRDHVRQRPTTRSRSDTPKTAVAAPPAARDRSRPGAGRSARSPDHGLQRRAPILWAISGEEAGLSHQAEQLAQQLAAAKSDSDREKIKGQLAETLEKQFDQRQKRHEEEIKSLEAQIKKLKDLVDKRQENRREIVSARLNQIVKESQGLGW